MVLDKLDYKLLELLAAGRSNSQIAKDTGKPLSTIQRRTRLLETREIIKTKNEINWQMLGYKTGLLHVYVNGINSMETANVLAKIPGITYASLHIGNSDIVLGYVVRDTVDLLNLISKVKAVKGLTKIVWSEQVTMIEGNNKISQVA